MTQSPAVHGAGLHSGYDVKLETIAGSGADLQLRPLLDRQQFHDLQVEAEESGRQNASKRSTLTIGVTKPSGSS